MVLEFLQVLAAEQDALPVVGSSDDVGTADDSNWNSARSWSRS